MEVELCLLATWLGAALLIYHQSYLSVYGTLHHPKSLSYIPASYAVCNRQLYFVVHEYKHGATQRFFIVT